MIWTKAYVNFKLFYPLKSFIVIYKSHTAIRQECISCNAAPHSEKGEKQSKKASAYSFIWSQKQKINYSFSNLLSPLCVSLSCVLSSVHVLLSQQEAALWTAHETSPPVTRHTSHLPLPEGHCFTSLHPLRLITHVYSHLFCARDVRETEIE